MLAGGSNVVVADEGFPGTVRADRHARRRARGRHASRSPPASRGTRSWPTAWPAAWPGVECLAGIPGSVGATPIQNVGAYGQEVAETIAPCACSTARDGAVRDARRRRRAASPTARARSSASPGAGWSSRCASPCRPRARSAPIRYAELARGPGRRGRRAGAARPTCARRCWRCAAARAWSSTPATPTPSRRARSSPTRCSTPAPSPRCGPAPPAPGPRRRAAGVAAGRRSGQDLGRVAHRARGLPPRPRQPRRDRDLRQAHARADQPRRGHDGRARRASRARSPAACARPSASRCARARVRRARLGGAARRLVAAATAIVAVSVCSRRASSVSRSRSLSRHSSSAVWWKSR